MNREKILDIFYNHIIKEAVNGRVDCFMMYNMLFNTRIYDKNVELFSRNENPELLIPTLQIKNLQEFDDLLVEYVNRALMFYDDSNYQEEVLNEYKGEGDKGISKEKVIMTLLWSNATIEDFNDPCTFLRKRISYFDLDNLDDYKIKQVIGYSEILDSNIECVIKKSRIESETPYHLEIRLINPEIGVCSFVLPNIYFGNYNGKVDVYAIQNRKDAVNNDKKIMRKMYKVNEGIDLDEDNYANYGVGNLKDITPSFLVAANIMCGLFKSSGINDINVVSILITRFNGKMIANDFFKANGIKKNYDYDKLAELLIDRYDKSIAIQMNLTDKFLRTFRRLGYHHSSIGITSYPMEVSSNMALKLYNQEDICNNKLLDETFNFDRDKKFSR